MQGPDLIFHLTDENYNFYQPDKDGLMIISSAPYFFQFSPDGWYNIEVKNIRNRTYWAVDRSVSIPLAYLGDAAKLIKTIVLTLGTEQVKAYLTILSQQLHHTPGVNYSYYYKKEFRGAIDLSSYNHEGVKVTVTTQEDGLPKYLKANEGNTLELPMNVPEAVFVKMDGVYQRGTYNWLLVEDGSVFISRVTPTMTILPSDELGYGFLATSVYKQSQGSIDDSSLNYFGAALLEFQDANLSGILEFSSPLGLVTYNLDIRIYNSTTGVIRNLPIYAGPLLPNTPLTINVNLTFTLDKEDKIFFVTDGQAVSWKEAQLKLKLRSRSAATYVPHFTGQYLFEKIIQFVTDGKYSAALSSFLNLNRNILFTSGDAIRNVKDSNGNPAAVMKITLKKFFKFWDCLYSSGLIALENTKEVNIDEKVNLADRTKVIRLASPETPPKVTLRKDLMWNVLKIGYPEIKNEVGVLNGNEAFCCGYEWRINATSSPAEINKISEIRADCYEQEIIRITLTDKDTTDNKRDNEIYANYVDSVLQPAGADFPDHRLLDRSLNATATGLLEKDTIWNLRLSPKRMLLNNGGFLRSSMLHCDGLDIIYSTADKNNRVSAGGTTEKDNISLGSAGTKFFYPVGITMQLPAPADILDLLNASPLSTIEVEIGGTVYTGIMEKSAIYLSGSRIAEHEILLDERNDLTKLIDYNG